MTVHEGEMLCGRYRLQQSVGRGGMADVYLAFDKVRQAQVAVKILREDLAEDPDFVRRFRREAEALAQLDHPKASWLQHVRAGFQVRSRSSSSITSRARRCAASLGSPRAAGGQGDHPDRPRPVQRAALRAPQWVRAS